MYFLFIIIVLVGESVGRFSEWNTWSPCSVTCGNGVRSRERVSKFETCYSELSDRKVCVNDPCVEHGNLTNVALGASVTASSVFLAAFPTANIVDGDESTDFYAGTCTQTNKDDDPWLRIELNDTATIREVVVFNRGDCCSERLNQMEITVGEDPYGYNNTLCGKRGVMDGVKMARVSCYESINGRYIFVRIPGPQYLALCEVKVYGRFIHRGATTGHPVNFTTVFGGYAKATSQLVDYRRASLAFMGTNTQFWHSGYNTLPQYLWFHFPHQIKVVRFSFKTRNDGENWQADGPSKYEFFGSNASDCSEKQYHFTLFKNLSGIPFQSSEDVKVGVIKNPGNFRCYGFKVIGVPGRSDGQKWTTIRSVKFYEVYNGMCITTTVDAEHRAVGKKCVFPFRTEGGHYCPGPKCCFGYSSGASWCATKVDKSGKMVAKHFGYCSEACSS